MKSSSKAAGNGASLTNVTAFCYAESGDLRRTEATGNDIGVREARARENGRREGETQARAVFEQEVEAIHAQVVAAIADFASQRAAYFRQVEKEVVQLALSIARRVLHREAQVDPGLLAGMVRFALEKIDAGTVVQLKIHPGNLGDFRSRLAEHPDVKCSLNFVEDASLGRHHCTIHTELGSTEAGLEAQFKEIEQGLLDLLAKRPEK